MNWKMLAGLLIVLSLQTLVSSEDNPSISCNYDFECEKVPGKPLCLNETCQRKRNLGEECFGYGFQCQDLYAECNMETSRCQCSLTKGNDGTPYYKEVRNTCMWYTSCNMTSDCAAGHFCGRNFCFMNPLTHKYLAPGFYGTIILTVLAVMFMVHKKKQREMLRKQAMASQAGPLPVKETVIVYPPSDYAHCKGDHHC